MDVETNRMVNWHGILHIRERENQPIGTMCEVETDSAIEKGMDAVPGGVQPSCMLFGMHYSHCEDGVVQGDNSLDNRPTECHAQRLSLCIEIQFKPTHLIDIILLGRNERKG